MLASKFRRENAKKIIKRRRRRTKRREKWTRQLVRMHWLVCVCTILAIRKSTTLELFELERRFVIYTWLYWLGASWQIAHNQCQAYNTVMTDFVNRVFGSREKILFDWCNINLSYGDRLFQIGNRQRVGFEFNETQTVLLIVAWNKKIKVIQFDSSFLSNLLLFFLFLFSPSEENIWLTAENSHILNKLFRFSYFIFN